MKIPLGGVSDRQQRMSDHEPPSSGTDATIEFGCFRISLRRRELFADGRAVPLGTRAFDLLMVLIEAGGSLVTKADLLERVWPGIFVTPDNLKVQISELRAALADGRDLIRTEFGRGYRFSGIVRWIPASAAEAASAPAAQNSPASDEDQAMALAAIRSRLISLEIKLTEALALLSAKPRPAILEFPRHRRCTDPSNRRAVSARPSKMVDWVAGG